MRIQSACNDSLFVATVRRLILIQCSVAPCIDLKAAGYLNAIDADVFSRYPITQTAEANINGTVGISALKKRPSNKPALAEQTRLLILSQC